MFRAKLAAIVLAASCLAWGYPRPSTVPTSWELGFKFRDVKRVKVTLPGEGVKTYWYMVYTVMNNTGRDVVFHPECSLVTDQLKAYQTEVDVPPEVLKAIKSRYKNTYPWMEHPRGLVGKLLEGKDNARDSVAVWPDFADDTRRFTIYIGGLSGEVAAVPNPRFVPGRSDPKKLPPKFVLRKTLRIQYALPTDPASREQIEPTRSGMPTVDWVMR